MIDKKKLQELYKDDQADRLTIVTNRPDKTQMHAALIKSLHQALPDSIGVELLSNKSRSRFHVQVIIPPHIVPKLLGSTFDYDYHSQKSVLDQQATETRKYLGCHDEDQSRLPIPVVHSEPIQTHPADTSNDVVKCMSDLVSRTVQSHFNTPPRNPGAKTSIIIASEIPSQRGKNPGEWVSEKTINVYRQQIQQASQGAYKFQPTGSARCAS